MGRVCSVNPGTAAAPAFAFKEQPGTGFYLAEEGKIGFSVNGEAKMFMTGTTRSFVADAGYAIDLPLNDDDHMPETPVPGMLYYRTLGGIVRIHDGTSWRQVVAIPDGASATENSIARFSTTLTQLACIKDSSLKEDGTAVTTTDLPIVVAYIPTPGIPVLSFSSNENTGLYYDDGTVIKVNSVIAAILGTAVDSSFKFFLNWSISGGSGYEGDLILDNDLSLQGGDGIYPPLSFTSDTTIGFRSPVEGEIDLIRDSSSMLTVSDQSPGVHIQADLTLSPDSGSTYKDLYCDVCYAGRGTASAPGLALVLFEDVGLRGYDGDVWFMAGSEISNVWAESDPPLWHIGEVGVYILDLTMDNAFIDLSLIDSVAPILYFSEEETWRISGGSNGLKIEAGEGITSFEFKTDGTLFVGSPTAAGGGMYMFCSGAVQINDLSLEGSGSSFNGMRSGSGYLVGLDSSQYAVYDTSSIRYKRDLSPISCSYCLSAINKLRPVSFSFINSVTRNIGFIAEEVFSIFPEVVLLGKDNLPSSIDYGRLAVLPILALNGIKTRLDQFDSSFVLNPAGVPFDTLTHTADLREFKEAVEKSRLSVEDLKREFALLSAELFDLSRRAGVI